jgi:hypothetical protein
MLAARGAVVDASEGRIRALQRLAYGADASDAERARAVDELAGLAAAGPGRDEIKSGDSGDPVVEVDRAPPQGNRLPLQGKRDTTPGRCGVLRWSTVAGAVGLLLGVVLGWGLSERLADSAMFTAASPSVSATPTTPLADTRLLAVFDRLPLAAEASRVAEVVDAIDPASVRLLATRVEGPAAYLARTADGEDVCLVLLLPAGSPRSECTVDGRLPADGLSILYGAQGYGLAAARLGPTGAVSLGLIVDY